MKNSIKEAYYSKRYTSKKNDGPTKRIIKTFVKRITPSTSDNTQNVNQANSNNTNPKEIIQITLKNIGLEDAKQIKDTLIPNAKVFQGEEKTKKGTFTIPIISFQVPNTKFAKWIKGMYPKMETILSSSNNSKYLNLDTLQRDILEAFHSAPSDESILISDQSLKELEEAIYDAIQNNQWDKAVGLYKKAITLVHRTYGVQLSPNNVQSIYLQAEKAGIKPTDKGAATNSYWEDGTEKFWPTFVRSAQAWRGDFGRSIKDEPKMKYVITSSYRKVANNSTINNRLKSQGRNSFSDLSPQEKEAIKNDGLNGRMIKGYAYDISDTEGPGDFFLNRGLLNNLEGELNDVAKIDNEEWLKKIKDSMDNNSDAAISDDEKYRLLLSSNEGRAKIFLDAVEKLCSTPKYEGGWEDLNVTINNSNNKIISYLLTIQDIAKKKIENYGWRNASNAEKIAQMITAVIAKNTVGESEVKSLGYNFSNVNNIFSSYEECKSTVLSISSNIISSLHRIINQENNQDSINENGLHKFFNLLERMDNLYNENYDYELTEGIINQISDDESMDFLKEFGLNFNDNLADNNKTI